MGSPLHRVIQWFKTMTTNEFIRNVKNHGWEPFENKIWQRNYYEHIIRNDESHRKISDYTRNNPTRWIEDDYFTQGNPVPAMFQSVRTSFTGKVPDKPSEIWM